MCCYASYILAPVLQGAWSFAFYVYLDFVCKGVHTQLLWAFSAFIYKWDDTEVVMTGSDTGMVQCLYNYITQETAL